MCPFRHPDSAKSIRTFREHTACIYSTIWHPKNADMFASTSGDCNLKIWDANGARTAVLLSPFMSLNHAGLWCMFLLDFAVSDSKSVLTIRAHDYEILTCDWNKYDEYTVVTGSVDKRIRTWVSRSASRVRTRTFQSGRCSPRPSSLLLRSTGHPHAQDVPEAV